MIWAARRRPRVALCALAVVVAAVLIVVVARGSSRTTAGRGAAIGVQPARIVAAGGVVLAAQTFTPPGPGHWPLLVMPVPFGSPGSVYDTTARTLVARGYEVVTYLQRGFHQSQGRVDIAGAATQRDVSTVITWALGHTPTDARHIGVFGLSYGAGMGLLAAAHDSRIRAVVALHTWTDLDESFDPNGTPSTAAFSTLVKQAASRLDPSLAALASAVPDGAFGPQLARLSPVRSPQSYVAQLNRNRPAIMIANAFEDSYFAPAQLVRFFDALTVPKRLELAPGDHGTLDYAGLRAPRVVRSAVPDCIAWLDHYLRGTANGVGSWKPVQLTDVTTGAEHTFASWPGTDPASIALGVPGETDDVGTPAAWSASLSADTDSGADFGAMKIGSGPAYRPTVSDPRTWQPGSFLSWTGAALSEQIAMAGTPYLDVNLRSSTSVATVFVYFYDVSPSGSATLMCGEPFTATGLSPGVERSVSIALEPLAWTVAAGDHLVVAVDTADPRYSSPTPAGAVITLSSTAAEPATVSLPVAGS